MIPLVRKCRLYAALLAGHLLLLACSTAPSAQVEALRLPSRTTQVVLCMTERWADSAATVQCLERRGNGWRVAVPAMPARVGRSGLGWGIGLHRDGGGPVKVEGDGRGPAGVFSLLYAFGYGLGPPPGLQVPYRHAGMRDYFVDASESLSYNQWQHIPSEEPNEPGTRWRSFERMRRQDDLYEFGVVVGHNVDGPIPDRGSAIFMHVWSPSGGPTSGCTSMSREDLLRMMRWLRAGANPLLIQIPVDELSAIKFACVEGF
jgi:L,D-peptidoglycan transpeptidase YkuD (ErfK/YbiS/YcfS/YnhG family)